LRFVELDAWALGGSVLHRRDARAKIAACVLVLAAIGTGFLVPATVLVLTGLLVARLPLIPVLVRACIVLPFSLGFILAAALAGRPDQALHATLRSYVSAVCVLTLIGATPSPALLDALRRLGAPPFLLEVVEFVYRYALLVAEQAKRMALAATTRGSKRSFAAVAGSVGVLFARSYERADAVHRAMLARGYNGRLHPRTIPRFSTADFALIVVAMLAFVWKP
jgi:cobalt/nickel transport system permease protein